MNLRNRERWYRWVELHKSKQSPLGFFDSYPRFFETSHTASTRHRLNERYRALIQANDDAFEGKTVLDIASHDGRWSLAARKAGAICVFGIEARQELVNAAQDNMRVYGIDQIFFTCGDVFSDLGVVDHVDTVLCFGFLYHTIDHMPLLRQIRKLEPKDLIIDTAICLRSGSFIELDVERTNNESAAAFGETEEAVIGRPTKDALKSMLSACSFRHFRYYDWKHAGITNWHDLKDYYLGKRVSLRVSLDNRSGAKPQPKSDSAPNH